MIVKLFIVLFMRFAVCLFEIVDIPDNIHAYCPYNDFCERKSQRNITKQAAEDEESCCASCACDAECGLRRDCCLDELDTYKLIENGIVGCYDTTSAQVGSKNEYYMIHSCYIEGIKENGKDRSIQNADESCMYSEKGKLLFEPVSTSETGFIYVNSKCAQCNRVFNYKPWNFYLNDSSIIRIAIAGENDVESRIFIPPSNEDLSKHICSFTEENLLHNCQESSRWYKLCKNLNAPFRSELSPLLYKNVFCAVCNGVPIGETCSKLTKGGNPVLAFSLLIDNSIVEMSRKAKVHEECFDSLFLHQKRICITVLCPEGMILTSEGCKYYVSQWCFENIFIQIRLIPERIIPENGNNLITENLLHLSLWERLYPASMLQVPCAFDSPFSYGIFYEINANATEIIQSVIVQLNGNSNCVNLEKFVSELRSCIKDKQWLITINTKQYIFKALFDKYSGYVQDGIQKLQKVSNMNMIAEEDTAKPKKYEIITNPCGQTCHTLNSIGKTFFCRQVHLSADEVEIGFGEIRILATNVTLGNNEYAVKDRRSSSGNAYKIFAVCLEDYIQIRNKANCKTLAFNVFELLLYFICFIFI